MGGNLGKKKVQESNLCYDHEEEYDKYCFTCKRFICPKCFPRHAEHNLGPSKPTLIQWKFLMKVSQGWIKNYAFSFKNCPNIIHGIRTQVYELYYMKGAEKYHKAFEDIVPYIQIHSDILKVGLESLVAFSVRMNNIFNNHNEKLHKVSDMWNLWLKAEHNAKINQDIDKYMAKLAELERIIQSKNDAMVVSWLRLVRNWFIHRNYQLKDKYATLLARINTPNSLTFTMYVFLPIISVVRAYQNISSLIGTHHYIKMGNTLYLCGDKRYPDNSLCAISLFTNEDRVVEKKPDMPYYSDRFSLGVAGRHLLVVGGTLSNVRTRVIQCFDTLSNQWCVLPGFPIIMEYPSFCVHNEQYVYGDFDKKNQTVSVLDLFDSEAGWKCVHYSIIVKQRIEYYYSENLGVFASSFDSLYEKSQAMTNYFHEAIQGKIYSERMSTPHKIMCFNHLSQREEVNYFEII